MRSWLGILLLFVLRSAHAESSGEDLTVKGIAEFTAAYQAWDGRRFAAAAALFRQATTNAPANRTSFYWLGVAEFHRMLHAQTLPAWASNKLVASAALDAALAALHRAVKLDPRDAESHALLGTLYGMKIDGNLIRGARFGPRLAEHCKQALETGAGNPRAQYLLGACQFHTAKKPAKQREALATFLQAEALFEAEAKLPAAPLDPRWGWSSCLTFIGRTYERLGERTNAAAYFHKALAQHPADHLAKEGLARLTSGK